MTTKPTPRDGSTVVVQPDRSPEALQALVDATLARAPGAREPPKPKRKTDAERVHALKVELGVATARIAFEGVKAAMKDQEWAAAASMADNLRDLLLALAKLTGQAVEPESPSAAKGGEGG